MNIFSRAFTRRIVFATSRDEPHERDPRLGEGAEQPEYLAETDVRLVDPDAAFDRHHVRRLVVELDPHLGDRDPHHPPLGELDVGADVHAEGHERQLPAPHPEYRLVERPEGQVEPLLDLFLHLDGAVDEPHELHHEDLPLLVEQLPALVGRTRGRA